MFEKMTSALHVPIFAREKAAAAQGLTRAEMTELAAQYTQEAALAIHESSI